MEWKTISVFAASWCVSLALALKAIRSDRTLVDKIAGIVVLVVPVLGPVFYWFIYDETPPQKSELQVRGARGDFTDSWISRQDRLENTLKLIERESSVANTQRRDSADAD